MFEFPECSDVVIMPNEDERSGNLMTLFYGSPTELLAKFASEGVGSIMVSAQMLNVRIRNNEI